MKFEKQLNVSEAKLLLLPWEMCTTVILPQVICVDKSRDANVQLIKFEE